MSEAAIYYCYNNKKTRMGSIDSDGFLKKDFSTAIPTRPVKEYRKYKKERGDISHDKKVAILSSWEICHDYDFLLSYCCLFTLHRFATLADRIYVKGKKKGMAKITRWGVGKRVYETLRKSSGSKLVIKSIESLVSKSCNGN